MNRLERGELRHRHLRLDQLVSLHMFSYNQTLMSNKRYGLLYLTSSKMMSMMGIWVRMMRRNQEFRLNTNWLTLFRPLELWSSQRDFKSQQLSEKQRKQDKQLPSLSQSLNTITRLLKRLRPSLLLLQSKRQLKSQLQRNNLQMISKILINIE